MFKYLFTKDIVKIIQIYLLPKKDDIKNKYKLCMWKIIESTSDIYSCLKFKFAFEPKPMSFTNINDLYITRIKCKNCDDNKSCFNWILKFK